VLEPHLGVAKLALDCRNEARERVDEVLRAGSRSGDGGALTAAGHGYDDAGRGALAGAHDGDRRWRVQARNQWVAEDHVPRFVEGSPETRVCVGATDDGIVAAAAHLADEHGGVLVAVPNQQQTQRTAH